MHTVARMVAGRNRAQRLSGSRHGGAASALRIPTVSSRTDGAGSECEPQSSGFTGMPGNTTLRGAVPPMTVTVVTYLAGSSVVEVHDALQVGSDI
jgi:hypothetical protein